ncbi:MAG TPA: protein kinase [Polyangiaceae bacterium]|nr:protein kinase [Polyangiaceae bacterium]
MTSFDAPLAPGSVVADRFVVERLAGEGGMGRVYRALDRHRGEVVALKIVSKPGPSQREGQRTGSMGAVNHAEARTLVELLHPNIVRCIAFGTVDGREFLATEWLEGETLRDKLARGKLPADQALAIVRLAAEGLAAAHAWGIVHRDVTPANVMVLAGDVLRVKVLDFGLAMQGLGDTRSAGTVGYAAPEQARGDRPVDARADVFGLGCVLYECLLGEKPFAADTDVAVLARMFEGETARVTERLVGVPAAIASLLARMLAADPEGRPRDAGAVAAELTALGVAAPELPSTRSVTRSEQRVLSVLVARTDKAGDARLHGELSSLGAQVDVELSTGQLLVCAMSGESSAAERAVRGARAALAIRRADARARVSIVAASDAARGSSDAEEALPAEPSIVVDEDTARLLGDRFVVRGSGDTLELVRDGGTYRSRTTLFGRETRCIGREREIALIASVFDECASEPDARVVWLTGPAGIGKSRVRDEVLRRIEIEPRAIWSAQADPTRAGVPLGILAELLRSAANLSASEDATLQKAAVADLAAAIAPADRPRALEFACELLRLPIAEPSLQLRAAREEAILMSDQLTRAFCDFALASTSSPLALVVEDLQWADLPSIRALDDLARMGRDRPLFVMLVGRPEAKDTHVRLLADRQPTGVSLGKLGGKAMEKLVSEVLGEGADAAVVASVAQRAGGNPFFAEELLRASQDSERASGSPTAAIAVVETRLSAFEPEARRVLRAASAFGQEFDARGAAALLGDATAEYVDAWCTWLAEREVLAQRAPGRWFFRQGLVRDGAYAMLTDADRRTAHGLASEWLEREGRAAGSVLAEHYAKAGEPVHAARWLAAAASSALEANDLAACVELADRALPTLHGLARGELLVIAAEAHRWRGEYDRAVASAREALELLPHGGPRFFRAAGELAAVAGVVGPVEAFESVVSLLASARPSDDAAKSAASMAWSRAALQLLVRGDARAEALLDLAKDSASTDLAQARVEQAFALRAGIRGHLEELATRYEASVAALERAGDLRNASVHELNLVAALVELGQDGRARQRLAHGAAEAARRGLSSAVALGKHLEGTILAREGRLEDALAAEREALSTFTAQGSARMCGGVRCSIAEVQLRAGAHEESEKVAWQAVDDLRSARPGRARALAVLAMAQVARGERDAALATSEQAVTLAREAGVEGGEALVHIARVEALALAGSPEVAVAKRAGRERLLAQATAIRDPALRESFLGRVPENAWLLELTK